MTLVDKLNTYSKDYWDFSEYRNDTPLVRYPAVMVAPMQACIMQEIINADNTIHNVLDPYLGSGTVLLEGQKLGLDVLGYDINPLAALISRVQLEGIPVDKAPISINALNARIALLLGNVNPFSFTNINKWFNNDVIASLSVIREAIMEETDNQIRRFFWCCFAETVKRYSNTRTSTFKLHVKEDQQVMCFVDDSIDFFKNHVQDHYRKYVFHNHGTKKVDIFCGDSRELLKKLPSNSVDLICSSPPYGDNHTTVTYGQFSILPLLWIDKADLSIWDDKLLKTFTAIDSASLGGTVKRNKDFPDYYIEYVKSISIDKRKKVVSFLEDYESVFKLLSNVLKPGKLIVLTLGNRRVDNQEIRFDRFNDMLANKYGLQLDSTIIRNIYGKRMPNKVSRVENHGAVNSMSKEYIKIYRKVSTDD